MKALTNIFVIITVTFMIIDYYGLNIN